MLQNNSLIVSLSVSQWTARKMDKKVTTEVIDQHNAASDAGRWNKLLVAKEHTDAIQKIASEARTFHYENTLAWGENNERLLPSKNYFTYVSKVNEIKGRFHAAVADFLKKYDYVIDEAKVRLNGTFNAKDYPTRYEAEDKFRFKISFMPVPSDDIRIELSNEEVASLREAIGTEINDRLQDAVKGTWDRIKERLTAMKERLSDPKAIFRDSLFDNLSELIGLLPKLNVTDDPNITAICTEMRRLCVDPNSVRSNDNLRSQKAQEVEQVLNKFSGFFQS